MRWWKINRVAWAGEVAGWMPSEVTCHLAKRGEVAADWKPALAKCFGDRIREVEPMSDVDLATATAEYATQSTAPGLMLEDYAVRYRQRFQDGLWMEGIKGAIAIMLLSLVAYFGYAQYLGANWTAWSRMRESRARVYQCVGVQGPHRNT